MPVPRELSTEEVATTVDDFRRAAAAAIAAGADGVEIHGANGYLVHQFLATNTNQRTDRYGGSIDNRIRFAVEVATAVADEIGAGRTGLRISPGNPFNDIAESDTHDLYPALVRALAPLDLAYLHIGTTAATTNSCTPSASCGRTPWSSTGPAPTSPPAPRTSKTASPTSSPSARWPSPTPTWSSAYAPARR